MHVYLTEDQAFAIYAAHVANAIYIEATHRVPWSILAVPHEELRILLASPSYFVRLFGDLQDRPPYIDPARAFTLPERIIAGDGLVCDPRVGYRFLSGESLDRRREPDRRDRRGNARADRPVDVT